MNTTEKEFFDAIGHTGIIKCTLCGETNPDKCMHVRDEDQYTERVLPKITADIRERLEELARQKDFQKNIRFGESVAENEFIYSFVTGKDVSPYIIHAYGKNRSDALLSLMTKLVKEGIIDAEKVREVFE